MDPLDLKSRVLVELSIAWIRTVSAPIDWTYVQKVLADRKDNGMLATFEKIADSIAARIVGDGK